MNCIALTKELKADQSLESSAIVDKYGEVSNTFGEVLHDIHADMINSDSKEEGALTEQEWSLLEAFARELSVTMNLERNLLLLGNLFNKVGAIEDIGSAEARRTCRPEEGMRYCEMIKEDVESLRELPETSGSMTSVLEAYEAVATNCRCFFLALCHQLTGKLLESAALLDMLGRRVEDVSLPQGLDEPLGRLHPLIKDINESLPSRTTAWRCRTAALLVSKAPKKEQAGAGPGSEAATFPPRVREIPCKPLLFDLAFGCIEEPDLEELLPKKKDAEKKGSIIGKVAGGIGSRLSGFWGKK